MLRMFLKIILFWFLSIKKTDWIAYMFYVNEKSRTYTCINKNAIFASCMCWFGNLCYCCCMEFALIQFYGLKKKLCRKRTGIEYVCLSAFGVRLKSVYHMLFLIIQIFYYSTTLRNNYILEFSFDCLNDVVFSVFFYKTPVII